MEKKQIFSIKKLKVGAASVLIGTGLIFLANSTEAMAADTTNNVATEDKINTETTEADQNSATTNNKSAAEKETTSTLAQGAAEAVNASLNDLNTETLSTPSALETSLATETPNYSGISLTGRTVDGKNEYTVGDQIISTFKLDVSAPSELKEGSYILITLPTNEPVTDVLIGTAIPYEKINDTTYKIKLGAVSGGSYATINVSYKFDKWRTGRNSTTTVTAQVFDGDKLVDTANTTAKVMNTNKSGYPYVDMDTNNGAGKQTLFETSIDGKIDESKNQDLELKLTTNNKELAAVKSIEHAVTLPDKVVLAQRSKDAGWTQEGNVAKWTRTISDAQEVFKNGNNTTSDSLFLDVRNAGTVKEFIEGKNFTFSDTATYTDKSGEKNISKDDLDVVVNAFDPSKTNPSAEPDKPVDGVNPLEINNFTRENSNEMTINTALPNVTADTDDRRIITVWRSGATDTKLKALEIDVDSDFDQKRSVEFYGVWTVNNTLAYFPSQEDAANINTSNTFEVYNIVGTTETKVGEILFSKNGSTKVELPDNSTKIILRPKGEMKFTNPYLTQIGVYLNQNLRGLDKAKKMIAEGKTPTSVVTAKVATVDSDEIKKSVSKTTLVDARTALKLVGRTEVIDKVLAGNTTQGFSSGIEAYNYSPAGLGDRVYGTYTTHAYDTSVTMNSIAKNPKIIVELPDGFTYAGVKDPENGPIKSRKENVIADDNYMNTGKRVVIIDAKAAGTRGSVYGWSNEHWNWIPLDIAFNVANWVPTGTYQLKYTLVWDEDKVLLGLNPNADYEGNATTTHTSTFTYEIPVTNSAATQLLTQVSDDNSNYTTDLKNLNPGDEVTYKFTLINRGESNVADNQILITLPKEDDNNIVNSTIKRNSQFPVEITKAADVPDGWSAFYYTGNESSAKSLENANWLTADQVTNWSDVKAIKFVSDSGTKLNRGFNSDFSLSAKISEIAGNKEKAFITAAVSVNGETTFNEGNAASVETNLYGTVKVAYVNTKGETIKETVTAIPKLIYGEKYDVNSYGIKSLVGLDGKKYSLIGIKSNEVTSRANDTEIPSASGTINVREVTVTFLYDEEEKKVTRTIRYIDAETKAQIADIVAQTVTLKRTGNTWSTANWDKVDSPTVANYGTPNIPTVVGETVTNETVDKEVIVEYPQSTEEVPESKTVTRTIKYIDAETNAEVADTVTQTATISRTNVRNKVTGVVTEGTWSTENWAEVTSPTVENYSAPDIAKVDEAKVTSTTGNAEVTVRYTQATENVPESKTVVRTIKYIDAETKVEVADTVTQTATITRTNVRNKATGAITEGKWSTAQWDAQASPKVDNYDAPDIAKVDEEKVTSETNNAEVTVRYTQATENVPERKTVVRTIKYVDAETNTEVAKEVTQAATISRTNVRNKVTGAITEGEWSTAEWPEVTSPTVENYNAPDKEKVASVTVTSATENAEEVVKYTQETENIPESKTVTRTIKYVDAETNAEVAKEVTQTATITRTNVRNKVTGKVTEGKWSEAKWAEVTSPTVENYNVPDIAKVDEAKVTSTTENSEVTVRYTQATENIPENKTVVRTIKYIDAETNAEVAKEEVQTATISRTNVRNKATGEVTEGTWSTANWVEVTSPNVENYNVPDKEKVASVTVTSATENAEEVVKYTQSTENIPENKTITRTIRYVDAADETKEVAKTATQTATISRTNVRKKVTGKVTEGTWSEAKWEKVDSPSVDNYDAPDKESVAESAVTSDTTDTTVTVKYPQSTEEVPESKTVTRTINYVDAVTGDKVAEPVKQTATISRTNVRNKVTGKVTEGTWSTANWDKVDSPKVDNYGAPDKASVSESAVTSDTTDTTVTVKYPQSTEEVPEGKTVTRTINYVDAVTGDKVAKTVTQTATISRTNVRNKVTGKVSEGTWSEANWVEVTSPNVENYNVPDKEKVASVTVTSATENVEEVVKYTQATEQVPESKTVVRTIKYIDAETNAEVADTVAQTATISRTNIRNKVTGVVTEGKWSETNWAEVTSPNVENYNAPDIAKVDEAKVTSETNNAEVTVRYTQATENVQESKTVVRTIKYVDAETNAEVAKEVKQEATISRTNVRNKVTGKVTEGTWSEANWSEVTSPNVENYEEPSIKTVESVNITPATENSEVIVEYKQKSQPTPETEAITESKTVTRTIKYVDAETKAEVAKEVTQTATITRRNVRNKVTGAITEGKWSETNWPEVTSPSVENYNAPDKEKVASVTVTSTTENPEEVVKYTQATENIPESKIVTRTIKYVDAETNAEVAKEVKQEATISRTNVRNKVTGKVSEGTWTKAEWSEVVSPSVEGYGAPSIEKVELQEISDKTENTIIEVKYAKTPKHEDPKHEDPKHEDPKHEDPKHEDPKHEDPKHEDPKHEDPKHEDPKHEDPKHEDPKHEDPKHEDPKHEDPKHEDLKHEDPKHEDSKHENKQVVENNVVNVSTKKELPNTQAETENNIATYSALGLLGTLLLRRKNKKN